MVGNGYWSLPSLRKKVSAIRAWSVWKAIRWPPAEDYFSVQSSCRRALSSAPAIMKASRWRADAAAGDAGAGCPDCRLRALATLTETIKAEELFTLPANDVLWRLYHEEEVTVYDPQSVEFKCTCSRERCAGALKTLPDEEIDSILADEGEIDMHCDYCVTTISSMPWTSPRSVITPLRPIRRFINPASFSAQGGNVVCRVVPDF